MRNIVTSQETLQCVEAGVMRLADYNDPIASLNKRNPPENKRPHNALTQLRFGDQERPQSVGEDVNGRYIADRIAVHYASTAG
jgi:hypothetical protein